jgi:hypothetical protein
MFKKTGGIGGFFKRYLLSFVMLVAGAVFIVLGSQAYITQPDNIMYIITTYIGGMIVLLSLIAAVLQDKNEKIESLETKLATLDSGKK